MSRARKENLIVGAMPVDLSAAALNGAWVAMSLVDLMSVFLLSGVGTAVASLGRSSQVHATAR